MRVRGGAGAGPSRQEVRCLCRVAGQIRLVWAMGLIIGCSQAFCAQAALRQSAPPPLFAQVVMAAPQSWTVRDVLAAPQDHGLGKFWFAAWMKLVYRQCTPKGELFPFSKCRQMMNGEKHILVFARVLQYPCDGPTLDRLYATLGSRLCWLLRAKVALHLATLSTKLVPQVQALFGEECKDGVKPQQLQMLASSEEALPSWSAVLQAFKHRK